MAGPPSRGRVRGRGTRLHRPVPPSRAAPCTLGRPTARASGGASASAPARLDVPPGQQHPRRNMKEWKQRERALELLSKEVGYVRKPHGGKLRVALAFPNTYFVGMSNLGISDGLQAVQRRGGHRLRALFPAAEDRACRAGGRRRAAAHARVADAGARLRRGGVLGVVRVGLHQRPDAAAAGRHSRCAPSSARITIRWC